MKIILTSESSINGDLENISAKRGILISKKIVLEIKPHDVGETYNKAAEEFENIIFQSKNAVIHSIAIHNSLAKNESAKMYCLGKYTKVELQKYFKNEVIHPIYEYSSENLLSVIGEIDIKNRSYLIIKGSGGRDFLEKEIRRLGGVVKVACMYKRITRKDFLKEQDLLENKNNYLVVSSKTALTSLLDRIKKFELEYKIILVVPNERIVEDGDSGLISDIMVIPNDSNAKEYIKLIEEHNGKQ